MRNYFNLDGLSVARVNPDCDDPAAVFGGGSLGGARIFAEPRDIYDDCVDVGGTTGGSGGSGGGVGVGSANCYLGYKCVAEGAYNQGVLYNATPQDEWEANVTPNECVDNSLCEFLEIDEDGNVDVVTGSGANPLYGCTDVTALNYDSVAEYDDGSCEYAPEPEEDPFDEEPDPQIQGCTNPNALNYDPNATIGSDALCEFEEVEPVGSLNTTTLFVAGGAAILLLLALRKR